MFLAIEEFNKDSFEIAVKESLSLGGKIIASGQLVFIQTKYETWGEFERNNTMYWAHVLIEENREIGDYPYPPTRTLE